MDPRELQSRLLAWERSLGIVEPEGWGPRDVDGKIGPRSRAALACYQRLAEWCGHRGVQRHDGVLDAATEAALRQDTPNWDASGADAGAAEGTIPWAAAVLDRARPGLTAPARQVILAQALFESGFGYRAPFNKTPDGTPSNNWGAIYSPKPGVAEGDRGTFPTTDLTADGKPWQPRSQWWSTPELGAKSLVSLISGAYPEAWKAAQTGDAWGYALGLWRDGPGTARPSYYTNVPNKDGWPNWSPQDVRIRQLGYAAAIHGQASVVAKALGEPQLVHLKNAPAHPGKNTGGTGGGGLAALALAVGLAKLGGLF